MIKKEVPVWEKSNLTLEEAAAYSGIGIHKLRELSDKEDCEFVLWIGTKRLLKRRMLDEYIERSYSIYNPKSRFCVGKVLKKSAYLLYN